MPQQTHIKTNIHKILLSIIFILVLGFGFGKGEKVEAADTEGTCSYKCAGDTEEITLDESMSGEGAIFTAAACKARCENKLCDGKKPAACFLNEDGILFDTHEYAEVVANSDNYAKSKDKNSDSCSGTDWPSHPIDCSLLMLLNFFIWLMTLASTIFGWIMIPESITGILSSTAIYNAWMLVRDTLNVFFIMFLLFSAFATVFQVDKYSYKKIWLNMLLMTLLVNFSFPISRFIIDISNMMMFYFAGALDIGVKDGAIMTSFASVTNLPGLLHSNLGSSGTALFASTIFVFIFTVTILTISVLFLIRTIALAILIVFSSLAFVGTAIPPLSSYASDWWKKLFSYAFFGPVMLFMMYVASYLMTEVGKSSMGDLKRIAAENSSISEFIATMSFSIIPIVILWMGLGIAQSMSIAGAGAVVGKAQGFMKGAGKWTAGAPWRTTKMIAKQTGIPGGLQQKWANLKQSNTNRIERWGANIAGKGPFAVPNALDQSQLKQIEEAKKRLNIDNLSETYLKNITNNPNANKFEKAAARQKLAELGSATQTDLDDVREAFGETSQVFMQLANKVKLYDPVAAFSHLSAADQKINFNDFAKSNQFDSKKINSNSWQNEDFMDSALVAGGVNNKEMDEILKKNPLSAKAIKNTLSTVADNHIDDNDVDKNIQLINFARSGSLSTSALNEKHMQDHVFSRLDGETGANIDFPTANSYKNEIFDNIKPGKITDFARNIKDVKAQKEILAEIKRRANDPTHPQNKIYKQHVTAIKKDASLAGAYEAA